MVHILCKQSLKKLKIGSKLCVCRVPTPVELPSPALNSPASHFQAPNFPSPAPLFPFPAPLIPSPLIPLPRPQLFSPAPNSLTPLSPNYPAPLPKFPRPRPIILCLTLTYLLGKLLATLECTRCSPLQLGQLSRVLVSLPAFLFLPLRHCLGATSTVLRGAHHFPITACGRIHAHARDDARPGAVRSI